MRWSIGLAVVGQLVTWSLFAAGVLGLEAAVIIAFATAMPVVMVWSWRSAMHGMAILTPERLEIQTPATNQLYRWTHIRSIELESLASRSAAARIMIGGRPSADDQLVVIRLKRSIRLGLLPRRSGTDVPGIPSLFAKTTRLRLEDAEEFIRVAGAYLERSRDALK